MSIHVRERLCGVLNARSQLFSFEGVIKHVDKTRMFVLIEVHMLMYAACHGFCYSDEF